MPQSSLLPSFLQARDQSYTQLTGDSITYTAALTFGPSDKSKPNLSKGEARGIQPDRIRGEKPHRFCSSAAWRQL